MQGQVPWLGGRLPVIWSSDKPITFFLSYFLSKHHSHTSEAHQPRCEGDLVGYDEENCFNSPAPVSSESLTNEGFADRF